MDVRPWALDRVTVRFRITTWLRGLEAGRAICILVMTLRTATKDHGALFGIRQMRGTAEGHVPVVRATNLLINLCAGLRKAKGPMAGQPTSVSGTCVGLRKAMGPMTEQPTSVSWTCAGVRKGMGPMAEQPISVSGTCAGLRKAMGHAASSLDYRLVCLTSASPYLVRLH